jgi:Protein of unknown function (DUF3995)
VEQEDSPAAAGRPAGRPRRGRLSPPVAYAAWWWAVAFAALSGFWAAGGRTGLHPLEELDATRAEVAVVNLGTAALKLTAGLAALATVQDWGRRLPRWLPLAAVWAAAVLMLGHALVNYLGTILIAVGVIPVDGPLMTRYRLLDLLLWEPVWLLGGILFALTGWRAAGPRTDRPGSEPPPPAARGGSP